MANLKLAWQNRIDSATLAGGSWLASLPLSNLKSAQVQKVARTSDAALASTKFTVDFGQARRIGVLALVVHNISTVGKVRLRGHTSAVMTVPTYDSGWIDVWPSNIIPMALREWEEPNFWAGTMSEEQRAGFQAPFIHELTSQQYLRYWLVEVDDTANVAGHIHIGRPFMSDLWTVGVNYSYGAGLRYDDQSQSERSLSRARYSAPQRKGRTFKCTLDWLTNEEAYSQALEMQRVAGITGEVLVIPDSDDAEHQIRRSFLGSCEASGDIAQHHFEHHSVAMQFSENL